MIDYEVIATCEYEVDSSPYPQYCGDPAIFFVWNGSGGKMPVCKDHFEYILKTELEHSESSGLMYPIYAERILSSSKPSQEVEELRGTIRLILELKNAPSPVSEADIDWWIEKYREIKKKREKK